MKETAKNAPLRQKGPHPHLSDSEVVMGESRPKSILRWMAAVRRIIATIIGQVAGKLNIEKAREGDTFQLAGKLYRNCWPTRFAAL